MDDLVTIKRIAITAFLLFHIVAIVTWAVPLNTLLLSSIKNRVAPYMLWSGLSQNWALFSPNPISIDSRLEAEITYGDGSMGAWKFPLPQDFDYPYFKERGRKWANDGVRMDENSGLWPDVARYVARLNNNRNSPPVTVKLVRHWSDIAPPGSSQPEPGHQFLFFTYSVKPGDLQ